MIQWNNDSMKQGLAYSQGQHRDWACVRKIGLNNIKQTPLHPQLQPQAQATLSDCKQIPEVKARGETEEDPELWRS